MLGRRLDRHALRSFLGPFAACLGGLVLLVVIFDLFERVDECLKTLGQKDVGAGQVLGAMATFYAGQVLTLTARYGGLACLAGAALTVAVLARNGELTAVRAAGVSLRRAFLPLLLFAALVGAVQVAVAERLLCPLAPAAEDAMNFIYRREPTRGTNVSKELRGRAAVWGERPAEEAEESAPAGPAEPLLPKQRCLMRFLIGRMERRGRLLERLSVTLRAADRAPDGSYPVYCVTAKRAEWRGGQWHLAGGRFFDYGAETACRPCARLACDIAPADLAVTDLGLAAMRLAELAPLRDDPKVRVEIWRRLDPPLFNLILLLIGLPLAVAGGARGGKLLPLGAALVLGLAYIILLELCADAARSGALLELLERFEGRRWLKALGGPARLAVDLAVALPHLAALTAGAWLYRRMDR